jgi:hypothetical protein
MNYPYMTNESVIIGLNRGIFVLSPPDGHTYNCGRLKTRWNASDADCIKLMTNYTAGLLLKFLMSDFFQ